MGGVVRHTLHGFVGVSVIVIKHGIAVGHLRTACQILTPAHVRAYLIGHAALRVVLHLGVAGGHPVNAAAVVAAVILNAAVAALGTAAGGTVTPIAVILVSIPSAGISGIATDAFCHLVSVSPRHFAPLCFGRYIRNAVLVLLR